MYPLVEINGEKLRHNVKQIVSKCKEAGITSIFGVVKVLAGYQDAINDLISGGITHIADSRIENLKNISTKLKKVLLRIPMESEVHDVVKYCDISLNSELETIKKLNHAARINRVIHDIIVMFDLGDLREGIWYTSDYINFIAQIIELPNIRLVGIGTNLTCYGSVIPTQENLSILVRIKEEIERTFNIKLTYISGGSSSSLPLVYRQQLPKGINNLRIGEAFFLGRETAYGKNLIDCYQDVFILKAQIVELKRKPSFPIGERGFDAFGQVVQYEDKGMMDRAILAIGKQDVYPENLEPLDKRVKILGASSDHLIVDCTNTDYKVGDIMDFKLSYGGLLQVMTSKYINKVYLHNIITP